MDDVSRLIAVARGLAEGRVPEGLDAVLDTVGSLRLRDMLLIALLAPETTDADLRGIVEDDREALRLVRFVLEGVLDDPSWRPGAHMDDVIRVLSDHAGERVLVLTIVAYLRFVMDDFRAGDWAARALKVNAEHGTRLAQLGSIVLKARKEGFTPAWLETVDDGAEG